MSNIFHRNTSAYGGTEYVADRVNTLILPKFIKFNFYNLIVLPGELPDILSLDSKPLIIWLHNTLEQYEPFVPYVLTHPYVIERTKFYIVPSEFAKKKIIEHSKIPEEKIIVINNGFEPIKRDFVTPKKNEPIELVYTSAPMRGLEVLLRAFPKVEGDFKLSIFTPWDIYHHHFNGHIGPQMWANQILDDERVMIYGKSYNPTIRKTLAKSHVFAYPSTWIETFCISLTEAISAGLSCVVPQVGAIPEVGGKFVGNFQWTEPFLDLVNSQQGHSTSEFVYQYEDNFNDNINNYADALSKAIQDIRDGKFDPTAQQQYVNDKFSWKTIEKQWKQLHDKLS
jgi:glycosyltransferase involved in cell wall biosynthesis